MVIWLPPPPTTVDVVYEWPYMVQNCIYIFYRAGQSHKGRRPRASSLGEQLYTCSECKYMSNSKIRYDAHFKQPKHVNQYRDRAYKGKYLDY